MAEIGCDTLGQLQQQEVVEGVFSRPQANSSEKNFQGELVDRLLAKIADLESKLYERELEGKDLIPALRGRSSSSIASSQAGVDKQLLSNLGDTDRQPKSAGEANKRDWLAVGASWLSKNALSRTAVDTITGDNNTAERPGHISRSSTHSRGPSSVETAVHDDSDRNTADSLSPRAGAQGDSRLAGQRSLRNSRSNQALPDPATAAMPSGRGTGQAAWKNTLKHYYRYYTPADDELDEDTRRVQEAAGAALSEANERLMEAEMKLQAAQAAQKQLEQQVAAAQQLSTEVEQLKQENLEAWQMKYELESQMAAYKANLDGMQRQGGCMQKELDDMRKQAQIWSNANSSEVEKMRAEAELLNGQLAQRSSELGSLRERLTAVQADRDRALQEKQQAQDERDKLQIQMQQVSGLQQQLATATAAAAAAGAAAADWEEKFLRERAVRRKLHEQLQVLRGNIRVMCRVRPSLTSSPSKAGGPSNSSCISFPLEGLLSVRDSANARQREFEFDAVFAPEATQEQVFQEVSPLIRSCADGYNTCIFAYGQTGSGKTYTMEGPAGNPGINSRALQELFSIATEESDSSWSFSVAMLEIYNEAVHDLLYMAAAASEGRAASTLAAQNLDVSGLPAGELPPGLDRVPGLLWRKVSNLTDVQAVLREGARARATAATALNAASSRSHALVTVKVQGVREGNSFTSLLHLVDLAGSERTDKSEVTGQQMKEAQAINKSLSALGDVISALQRRNAHIPFRNSKLTQVLQDSLSGTSKVLLVCNLSPESVSCSETLSSLNFASRAAQVELGQTRRVTGNAATPPRSNTPVGDGVLLSPEADSGENGSPPRRTTSNAGAAGGSRTDGGAERNGSPSKGAAAGRTSLTGVLGGSPGRPVSRLSEKPPAGPTASPRVSGVQYPVGKPARH